MRRPFRGRTTILIILASVLALATAGLGTVAAPVSAQQAEVSGGCAVSGPNATYSSRVALSSGHARVWRLYQAFFLRQPDLEGFQYWLGVRSSGSSLGDIAYQFAQGPEFLATYGDLSHEEFVDLAYDNVLCRAPDSEGRAYWAGELASGRLTRLDDE